MVAKETLRRDIVGNDDLSRQTPNIPLVSTLSTDWGGLYLHYYRQLPFEMVEHSCPQHRIIIHDRTSPSPIFESIEGLNQLNSVSSGTVRVLPANTQIRANWEVEHQFIVLSFEPDVLARHIAETSNARGVELLPILNPSDPLIHGIGLTLKTELESGGIGGRLYVDAVKTALMAHLLRHYSVQNYLLPSIVNGLPKRTLQQVVDYIHAHLNQDLTLTTLAAIACMSPSYFSRLFKQSTGRAPHQYVIRCRIDRAKQLLLQGELSLAEIAHRLGFAHQSHLSHHFKRQVGSSPKAFLNSQ
ncbi:helix-turn-helix domain-containing protein [Scytonema sp. UIC 10036]|uniref:helix-turn-helix domain-containing protein n=1 Tax=Scytonema sp. UIC 10036 TaxID=2304196 RepID=UPI0012DA9105|nr:AraC family transcriptional regulator [Scytonema sp. UIC 10036]MUG95956.1 helix-turn-helix domain-containing protein [Scytonema sp. UIC 10036]